MKDRSGRGTALVLSLVIGGGLLPIVLHWGFIGRVPSVSPAEARAALTVGASAAALVDVRDPAHRGARQVEGSFSWPIGQGSPPSSLPAELRGRTLYLICDGGIRSARAVAAAKALTGAPVFSVRGGLQAWIAGDAVGGGKYCVFSPAGAGGNKAIFRPTAPFEQWLAFVHAFVLKPIYTMAALGLVILLWRRREPDLRALRWGLLAFFIGEEACAANFLFMKDGSSLLEYLHDYGMVLCFGFCAYALIVGLDARVIRYSDPAARCALLGLCRTCIKHAPVPCGLERSFYLILPASLVLAAMPFFTSIDPSAYTTEILGRTVPLSHPVIHQIYESRVCGAAAVLLLGAALFVFSLKRADRVWWAELLFAAGAGPLGFALFRLGVFWGYRSDIGRFNLWEEVTEFLFIAAVAALLWIFRKGLLARGQLASRHRSIAGGNGPA